MVGFLYGQTEYSMLENTIKLSEYISYGVNNKFEFLSITDYNLSGHIKFYYECHKYNIKPIIGLKAVINSAYSYRQNSVLLYAKNKIGYKNLLQIATKQSLDGIVPDEYIISHNEGLVLVSSALDSDFEYSILQGNFDYAKEELSRLQRLSDSFYLGLMPSSFIFESIYDVYLKIISETNIKLLPVEKTSYVNQSDIEFYHTLLQLNEKKIVPGLDDLHLKSRQDIEKEFSNYSYVFKNLESVINSISEEVISSSFPLPIYQNEKGISSYEYLSSLCEKGLNKRLINSQIIDKNSYQKRLNYELDVIHKMNYDDYFLIVFDIIRYAKKSNIMVGPGRGSSAGSLVAYCLGITDIDPIKYDLLFERFLNPERITMPDIDMDFADDKRDLVIKYVCDKYGNDHVCNITAFNTFQKKSAIRELFKLFGYDQKYINPLLKIIEEKNASELINKEFENHPEIIELTRMANCFEGLPRFTSTHAAGIILSSYSIKEILPLQYGTGFLLQSQLEACDLEKIGLLKIDFLGIRNLSILQAMIKEIKAVTTFDIKKIPLTDEKTYNLLSNGETLGIFQLESQGITNVIKKMKPSCFEDLVALLALYRPGPMENIDEYILRKNGKKFSYLHPSLESILKSTYGIIIYQEQIMRIAQTFAGYSLGEADLLRRAVSKKQLSVLNKERDHFVECSIKCGYEKQTANQIYDYIVKFANYGFNRSHSVAYALLSYQMAYIKANYKAIFIAKELDDAHGNFALVEKYLRYCKHNGITVCTPNINKSSLNYLVSGNYLLIPLNFIKLLSSKTAIEIINERKKGLFQSFSDFQKRTNSFLSKDVYCELINAGAFDHFGINHSVLLQNANFEFVNYCDKSEELTVGKELSIEELRRNEQEALGFNLKYDLFYDYEKYYNEYKATNVCDLKVGTKVNVIGFILKVKEVTTKKNEKMAFIVLNCYHDLVDIVCFSEVYNNYQEMMVENKLVLINGMVRIRNSNLQIEMIRMKIL